MTDPLALEDLAARTGIAADSLREWQAWGLIGRPGDAALGANDVRRVQLIRSLLRRGIPIERLVDAERAGKILGHSLDLLPPPVGKLCSLAEAAARLDLDAEVLGRLVSAAGLAADDLLYDDDVERFRACKLILESGLPEEGLVQLLRVYAEALGRVAEAEGRLFHFYVHERLRAQGVAGDELAVITEAARLQMMPLVEPAILYFHRRGFARAIEDDVLLHLQEEVGTTIPGQLRLAVAFVDLVSFTPLADAMGDPVAVQVLARFSHIVHEAVSRAGGRIVKQIGDAFMLVFSHARAAVSCVMEIERRAATEPRFPAVRGGIQWGVVLYRDGDYVGGNVNLASRLADAAERNQVLVTAAVKSAVGAASGIEFGIAGAPRAEGHRRGGRCVRGGCGRYRRRRAPPGRPGLRHGATGGHSRGAAGLGR